MKLPFSFLRRVRGLTGMAVLLVLAALAVACGEDATATPVPAPAATVPPTAASPAVTVAVAPAATPTPPPSPTATPTPTTQVRTVVLPVTATPAPTPAPTATPAPPASDAYFALDRVLDIAIEIDADDWDTLRHQTRTFDDLMAEIERYNLSRPFASIYDWFSGQVTVDGETYGNVGVRKKGFLGSQSDTKPSLKLRFDKYVDGQSLGGAIERMTLNNSKQDPSMVNTCLAYQIFAAAGLPSSRCSFATVSVNGKNLGLYIHVEEIKAPFLARHFDSAEGNLYEGTVSDFTPRYRGTLEKKTNEDADDWSDIDALVAALQDTTPAGLEALGKAVDLDRFLSFWATEVLVGHWDGYTGDRNNYHFYREPDGPFVFIPWGVDDVFHLKDDPNPFDNISNPPPSVLALTAIPNRLYNIPEWRTKYAARLKQLLDTVWDEDKLLASVDQLAGIVAANALPENRAEAAKDAERVRKFILKRRGEILADLTPEPPDWPEPDYSAGGLELDAFEIRFDAAWGTLQSANPLEEGTVYDLNDAGEWVEDDGNAGAIAGRAGPQQEADIGAENLAMVSVMGLYPDGTVQGVTFWLPIDRLSAGAALTIGVDDDVGGAVWNIPPGGSEPEGFIPVTGGEIEITAAGTEPGAVVSGRLFASFSFDGGQLSGVGLEGAGPLAEIAAREYGAFEAHFSTAYGSNAGGTPGAVDYVSVVGSGQAIPADMGVVAGAASPEQQLILPGVADTAAIDIFAPIPDGSLGGITVALPKSLLVDGAVLVFGEDVIGGGMWSIPAGASAPDWFAPFSGGRLELDVAGAGPGAAISGRFYGAIGGADVPESGGGPVSGPGLIINEVAASGEPLDWFELYNATDSHIDLANFVVADDLVDAGKRVAFPPNTVIGPGEYLRIELDKDGWPGFGLGGDEELGIWTLDGILLAQVDWDEGQSGEGQSYARIPDATGDFQTTGNATPGAANRP